MKIVYAGPFTFPSSNANSLRVQGIARALVTAGHEVSVYCIGPKAQSETIDGVRVTRVPEYSDGFAAVFGKGVRGLFLGDATIRALEENDERPDAVILYGTHTGYLARLLQFCRRNRVSLFVDVVEWYQPSHLPGGAVGPFAIANEFSMRVLAKQAHGVLAISRFLESHFLRLGCEVMRVPPLFEGTKPRAKQWSEDGDQLHFCYVGTPGRKENLEAIMEGLDRAAAAGTKFVMHFVGITAEDAQTLTRWKDSWDIFSRFYGRVSHSDAEDIIASCDFMVLVREDKRFSRAGFPSKAAESLSLGTPLLSNLSSNLDEYLDSTNSILISEPSSEAVCESVTLAGTLTNEQLGEMKEAARLTGARFSPDLFISGMSTFISNIVRRARPNA